MARLRPVGLVLGFVLAAATVTTTAQEPERTLALHKSIAEAKVLLDRGQSNAALDLLEKQLTTADGNRAFLDLLRTAYDQEAQRVASSDPTRATELRTKLRLLDTPPAPKPEPSPTTTTTTTTSAADSLRQAVQLFNQARSEPTQFGPAAKMFASAFLGRVEMSPEQLAAWAYCRVRLAADQLNRSGTDPVAASAVLVEVREALQLAPTNAALQKVGQDVIVAARARGARESATATTLTPKPASGEAVETANFRVIGPRALAETVGRAAETRRDEIFARWSGPAGAAWQPKCEIVLHPTGEALAQATKQPAGSTGHAIVKLDTGRVLERRLDLRADDESVLDVALPRELTHVVLADLFRDQAPPKWAEIGMAALATHPTELHRTRRTLARCYENGELYPVEALMEVKTPPTERLTGYYVGSVSLVDFLVRWKGDKAFTTFLRDSQRYGVASAMKRQYGVADTRQLEAVWSRSELTVARGQGQ